MSHQTEYDLRMRRYKSITDTRLIPRTPVIIQIDGRALLKGAEFAACVFNSHKLF